MQGEGEGDCADVEIRGGVRLFFFLFFKILFYFFWAK